METFVKDLLTFNHTLDENDKYSSVNVNSFNKFVMIHVVTIEGLTQIIKFVSNYTRNFRVQYYKRVDQYSITVQFN